MTEQGSHGESLGVEDTYEVAMRTAIEGHWIDVQVQNGELFSSAKSFPPRAAEAISEILRTVGPDSPNLLSFALGVSADTGIDSDENVTYDQPISPEPEQEEVHEFQNRPFDNLIRYHWVKSECRYMSPTWYDSFTDNSDLDPEE